VLAELSGNQTTIKAGNCQIEKCKNYHQSQALQKYQLQAFINADLKPLFFSEIDDETKPNGQFISSFPSRIIFYITRCFDSVRPEERRSRWVLKAMVLGLMGIEK